ncbi:MAG: ATP-grasp domain-containing protein [Patescibacteria group bacterium]
MKITVVYNQVKSLVIGNPEDILSEEDTVVTARAISENLATLGHEVSLFDLNEKSVGKLKSLSADFIFNCAYGIGSAAKSEPEVPNLLAKTGIPFSGSHSGAIILTNNKIAAKEILRANNLPTPGSEKFPLIVKLSDEHCSLGITDRSVVKSFRELRIQTEKLKKAYSQNILIEEFIDGRELNVTVLGNEVLPISEIIFGPSFKNKYKIVDFAAKWEEKSLAFKETNGVCPAILPKDIEEKIKTIAVKAVSATNCLDYTRVDFRLSKDNAPYILDINANPAIGPDDGATRSAKAAGFSYPQFLQKIIDVSLARFNHKV